jgi:hypothetical protein
MHHSGMGLSIYKGPIPPRNVEMVFHQVLYTKGSWKVTKGERMVFGEYKKKEQQNYKLFTQKERKLGWSWKIHNFYFKKIKNLNLKIKITPLRTNVKKVKGV